MTTIERVALNLIDAVQQAGSGGVVEHTAGSSYTVNQDGDGTFTLSDGPSEYNREPLSTFVQGREWYVTPADDSDESEAEAPQVVSLRTFFSGLDQFTLIRDQYTEYVFLGWEYTDGGNTPVARVIHTRYMEVTEYGEALLDSETTFTVDLNEDGSHKQVDRITRHALRHLGSARSDLKRAGERVGELEKSFAEATSDLKRVNEFINDYADETHMCSDYERRIFGWNDSLTFKLQGRRKNYFVPVTIPSLYRYSMSLNGISATSPGEAREIAKNMSTNEILRNLLEQGYDFNEGVEFDGLEEPTC